MDVHQNCIASMHDRYYLQLRCQYLDTHARQNIGFFFDYREQSAFDYLLDQLFLRSEEYSWDRMFPEM